MISDEMWNLENRLGFSLLFLPPAHTRENQETLKFKTINQNDCSKITFLNPRDSNIQVLCYYRKIGDTMKPFWTVFNDATTIVLTSCYEELFLYFYTYSSIYFYHCHFCSKEENTIITARKLILFKNGIFLRMNNENTVQIDVRVDNLKSKEGYHCQTEYTDEETFFDVSMDGIKYKTVCYQCIFCFIRYTTMSNLIFHINNSHYYYKARMYNNDSLIVEPNNSDLSKEKMSLEINFQRTNQIQREKTVIEKHFHLKRFRLAIDDEYDDIDTSAIATEHLNKKIENCQISSCKKTMMKTWNFLRIQGFDTVECLFRLKSKYGICKDFLILIDLLFRRGCITSQKLLEIIS